MHWSARLPRGLRAIYDALEEAYLLSRRFSGYLNGKENDYRADEFHEMTPGLSISGVKCAHAHENEGFGLLGRPFFMRLLAPSPDRSMDLGGVMDFCATGDERAWQPACYSEASWFMRRPPSLPDSGHIYALLGHGKNGTVVGLRLARRHVSLLRLPSDIRVRQLTKGPVYFLVAARDTAW